MKENKAPSFVKLFLPQNDKISQKQLISSWGQPHPKSFQIVDNPSIINRIATEINQNRRQYNSVKTATQPSEYSTPKKPLYIVKKTKQNRQRIKFSKLNQEVNCLSAFIENQVAELSISQIFQYKQKMLTTFLHSFFEELERQCHEKASFIKQVWNQTISLFDRIFVKQSENSLNYEKSSLSEIIGLHKSYQQIFEKMKKEKQAQINELTKFKEIIRSLVRNIRQRQKEIKVYKGGIDDYNNKLNNLQAQFVELKKQHIDILMYGHEGSMTKQEAEEMLARILKPDDQEEQDLRQFLSIKYIPPKLAKGKSEKFIKFSDQTIPQTTDTFQTFDQVKQFASSITPVNVQLKRNFTPKRTKFRDYPKCVDAKLQTDTEDFTLIKVNQQTECNYFTKMQQLIIKNKYCQTESKKVFKINQLCQTDITGVEAFNTQKKEKLQITSNLFDANIRNSFKKNRSDCKSQKFTTLNFLKSQYQLGQHLQEREDSSDEIHQSFKEKKQQAIKQVTERRKKSKHLTIKIKGSTNSKNLTPIKQTIKPSKGSITKSIKTRIKTKPQENYEQQMVKSSLKTQNFIKLNKMRASNEIKNKITELFSANEKIKIQDATQGKRNAGLLRSYFDINEKVFCEILGVSQQMNLLLKEEGINKIFLSSNFSDKLLKTFNHLMNHPSQQQLDLALYFNNKNGKNKNITLENREILEQLDSFPTSLDQNPSTKKNQPLSLLTQFQTFTIKKAYKIIEQVFQISFKILQNHHSLHINFPQIIERLFSPSTLTTLNNSRVQSPNKPNFSIKTIEFLKYLIRNINENYLFKNFLFLCGINHKINQNKEQTAIFNINRTNHIGQKPQTKKTIHIETVIQHQLIQKEKKDTLKKNYGTLVYSTQVIFYLDMLKTMNCYSNSINDIANCYTTLEMVQTQFEKIQKYYKDQKLNKTIKDVIEESLRPSTLINSKLNIFKCLQIFLEKVRQRKIEMMNSYFGLYESIKDKVQNDVNHFILVQILALVKAPPQTQLKIMLKMFKKCQFNGSYEDLMTFFVMEGFPDIQILHQGLVKSTKQTKISSVPSSKKLDSLFLDYFNVERQKKSSLKSVKYLKQINESLKIKQTIEKELQCVIGDKLSRINLAHIFLMGQE